MGCWYRPQANQLWSVWYCLFILTLQGYLLYLGITKYSLYAGSQAQWQSNYGNPEIYLIVYISLHGLVIGLVPFFIGSAVFKIGNLASDGEKLGARGQQTLHVTGSAFCRKIKAAWQHGPPVAQTIHLIMAFALLMANLLMEGQLFKHRILQKEEDFWSTELDFIFNVDGRMSDLVPAPNVTALTNGHNTGGHQVGAKLLPILMSLKLFGISLEFFNYLLALLIFAAVYPSAFWRANKPFGFLFSCHLIVHALAAVFSYVSFRLLYRIQNFGVHAYSNVFLRGKNPLPFLMNEHLLLAVYVASAALIFFASAVVYGYGYNKFCLCLIVKRNQSRLRTGKTYYVCCEGYSPHISAIVMLILMVGCKSPLLYDQMVLCQHNMKPVLLACIISDVAYLFCWILLWLLLTLIREWKFKTRFAVGELGHLQGMQTADGKTLADNSLFLMCGEEMYATDEETKKAALLRLAEKCGMGQQEDDVYWLKPYQDNGGVAGDTGTKKNHETNHLLPSRDRSSPQDPGGKGHYKKAGYYKVSFDEVEPTPLATPATPAAPAVVRYPPQRMVSAGTSTTTGTGSYVRFNDDTNYDHAQDVVTTFGTLPRGDYGKHQQQRIVGGAGGIQDREFFTQPLRQQQQQPQHQNVVSGGGPPSETGSITYASIHKRGSPSRGGRSDYARLPPAAVAPTAVINDETQSIASRGSSYANIPNHRHQNSWDTGSLGRAPSTEMARPPTGRPPKPVINNGMYLPQQVLEHNASYSSIQSQSMIPQHQQQQQGYHHQSGTPNSVRHRVQYASATAQSETVAIQPRYSPKHSPSQERALIPQQTPASDPIYGIRSGGVASKMSSFVEASPLDAANNGGGPSSSAYHQHQAVMMTDGPLATSGSSGGGTASSREATPQSNGSGGSLSRPKLPQHHQQQQANASWRANPIYGHHSQQQQTPANYSTTPISPNSLEMPLTRATVNGHNGAGGHHHANGSHTAPMKANSANNTTNLNFDHRDRNDSANFSLTSSNESDNQFVTSMV